MTTTVRRMTAEDLLDMPDDGFRYELVRGELRKMWPAGLFHGEYAGYITSSLGPYVRAQGLGKVYVAETGFRLASNPDHVRVPDVGFISSRRLQEIGESEGFFAGAPDIAVEVVSPRDRYSQVEEKVADWLGAGAQAVIVVDPSRRAVKVHRSLGDAAVLTEGDVLSVEDVVPGWQMSVAEVFGDLRS